MRPAVADETVESGRRWIDADPWLLADAHLALYEEALDDIQRLQQRIQELEHQVARLQGLP